MAHASIAKTASRLKLGMWIVWACILLVYIAGRFGLGVGLLRVQSHAAAGDTPSVMAVADATMVLLTIALWQLSRMLAAIAAGDLFSARVVGAFRSFALWLLIVALVWIAIPIALTLLAGPGPQRHLEFKLQLRDLMTIGITLILFLVARVLERARTIDEEMREIV